MTTDPAPDPDALGYADALAELEVIVDRLEHDDLDVDRLATDVARAARLVATCRDRIEAARIQVEQVVAGLADGTGAEGPPGTDPTDG